MTKSFTIYTIGHSKSPVETIIGLLKKYSITVLMDVRSVPFSRFSPQFNQKRIQQSLLDAGIRYDYAGSSLGGRPNDPSCYKDGKVPTEWKNLLFQIDYAVVMKKDFFLEGIQHLMEIAQNEKVALMCAEEDPADCHRHHLLGRYLAGQGITVLHIRKDGSVTHEESLSTELHAKP